MGQKPPGKSCKCKSFECVWPMKFLCKLVTNPLKSTTKGVCSPYKFVQHLGLGALWPRTTALDAAGALTRVSNKLPVLRVVLSWRPSLFPLGDSDIGHNKCHVSSWKTPCKHYVNSYQCAADSGFAFWNFLEFFFFSNPSSWLSPQMWRLWIWRVHAGKSILCTGKIIPKR